MNKKIIIILSSVFIILVATILFSLFFSKGELLSDYERMISTNIELIDNVINKYEIKNQGEVEVTANYKGAHGENYPATFNYNYELSDKLYLENEEYSSIDIDDDLLKIIDVLKKLKNVDITKYKKKSNKKLTYDANYINEVLGTDFKNVRVDIKTRGFNKRLNGVVIYLDDIKLEINNKNIYINYDTHVSLNKDACYVNVKNKLRMNIFIKETISFSIVLNDQVYSLELMDDGMNIKFSTSASIYNSLDIKVKYKDITLNKNKELSDYKDNPIIRYLSESDLSL